MKFYTILVIGLAITFLMDGCRKAPNGGIPIYIKVDSGGLVNSNVSVRDECHNSKFITDVWVEAGASNLGAYEMPTRFPVLQDGDVSVTFSAGVWESGQSYSRVIYPFYEVDTFTIHNATPGQVYTHNPVFRYKQAITFKFIEDFEAHNGFNNSTLVSDSNVDKRYGNSCCLLTIPVTDSNAVAQEITPIDLSPGQEIWMELDYKSDVPFWIGFIGYNPSSQYDVIYVNPQTTWHKLYLKLGNEVGTVRSTSYSFYFNALNVNGTGGHLYIDNVKVISY